MDVSEKTHQQDLRRIEEFRYMDDDFMQVCLEDNYEGVELILQIVLGKPDIKVKSLRTQDVGRRIEGDANCELFFQPLSH